MSLRQALYRGFMPGFRGRRHADFRRRLDVQGGERILDVGGYPAVWDGTGLGGMVTCLNLDIEDDTSNPGRDPAPEVMVHGAGSRPDVPRRVRGDARDLPFADGAFDVAFSNSVIEHVGAWEDQRRFAAEIRRVAPRLWVQTPNRWFPVEPHLVAPLVHFLPRRVQPVVARWATPWGWENRPTAGQARAFIAGIRLLTFREMRELFPDCEILRERWMGMTKSFIAVRGKA